MAIEFSHWKSPVAAGGPNLPSPDCVRSEASAVPPISEHLEPASCPASLSVSPLPTCSASQETLCDSSTSKEMRLKRVSRRHAHALGYVKYRTERLLQPTPCIICRISYILDSA